MEITREQLRGMFEAVANIAVQAYRAAESPKEDRITQREAYRQFGWGNVERWKTEGRVKPTPVGNGERCRLYYSRLQLLTLQQAEKQIIIKS